MKMLIALTTFAVAALAEKVFKPRTVIAATQTPGELTEEIRRDDIEDLILS